MASTQGSIKNNITGPPQSAPAERSFNQNSSISNSTSLINEPKGSSISDPSRIDVSGAGSGSGSAPAETSSSNAESSKPSDIKEDKKGKKDDKKKKPEKVEK